jgi:hypothetical protein
VWLVFSIVQSDARLIKIGCGQLYLWFKRPHDLTNRRLGGLQSWSGCFEKIVSCLCWKPNNNYSVIEPAVVTTAIMVSQLL